MSDAPPPIPPKPLEYFHSKDPVPLHPAVLALCTIAGAIVGGGVMVAVGGAGLAAAVSISSKNYGPGRGPAMTAGIIAFVAAAGFVAWWIVKFKKGRSLPIEKRRRGGQFFLSGFIIGCCLVCLLEGLCFSAFSSG